MSGSEADASLDIGTLPLGLAGGQRAAEQVELQQQAHGRHRGGAAARMPKFGPFLLDLEYSKYMYYI